MNPAKPTNDRALIYTAAFLRALATGLIGVLLGIHLAKLGFDRDAIGVLIGAGLAGAACAALLTTLAGDRAGRKRFLIGLALLAAAGGAVFAVSSTPVALGAAAFLGMLNGMGRDRGASLILEQAILPATTPDSGRTRAFAFYNVLQDAGHALGALFAGLPSILRALAGMGEVASFRAVLLFDAVIVLSTALLYLRLSKSIEVASQAEVASRAKVGSRAEADSRAGAASRTKAASPVEGTQRLEGSRGRVKISPASRSVLWRISSLFALDSLGGGFLTTAVLSYFFYERFGTPESVIGVLFFSARILNALSHIAAAWLAARFGVVNTMVFTHIPSSLLLATVPFAPSFLVAAALFLLREGLVEMDVPTRQSYVMAVVRPEERTFASGVTHLVRLGAWAVAPSFAGLFMKGLSLGAPLVVGAVMKIVYDGLLYLSFRRLKPPEEREQSSS